MSMREKKAVTFRERSIPKAVDLICRLFGMKMPTTPAPDRHVN